MIDRDLFRSAVAMAAPVASATDSMTIGTNIAVAFARSPFSLAMTAWDLRRASEGRLLLGLGT